tara:strand:+ start:116 stop:259 length:144 start_codon:yes stop_codon:yes gene_type:complete
MKCDKNCINGIIIKQIALADYISYRCDCAINKELEAYDNWFGILRKA